MIKFRDYFQNFIKLSKNLFSDDLIALLIGRKKDAIKDLANLFLCPCPNLLNKADCVALQTPHHQERVLTQKPQHQWSQQHKPFADQFLMLAQDHQYPHIPTAIINCSQQLLINHQHRMPSDVPQMVSDVFYQELVNIHNAYPVSRKYCLQWGQIIRWTAKTVTTGTFGDYICTDTPATYKLQQNVKDGQVLQLCQ